MRVRRGGSWDGDLQYARVAARYHAVPDGRYGYLGVRLLRAAP
jgi:formylglycine-generating enzyme required for sulfatase activity